MLNEKRKCGKKVNENIFEVINIIFQEDSEISRDLRKLVFYQNTKQGVPVSPILMEDVSYKDLFLKNLFPFKHIPNIQDEVKTYINVYYDGFFVSKMDKSRREETGFMFIDILTHKDMEIILGDDGFEVRKYTMLTKIRELFDNNRDIAFLGGLRFHSWGEFDSPSARHTGFRMAFSIMDLT